MRRSTRRFAFCRRRCSTSFVPARISWGTCAVSRRCEDSKCKHFLSIVDRVLIVRITDISLNERPRERLARRGPDALSDRELLALLLGSGTREMNAIDLAHELLARFGSLSALARCHVVELSRLRGIGPARAASVVAAFSLAARASLEQPGSPIRQPGDIARLASTHLVNLRRERALLLVCDAGNRVRWIQTICEGALDHTLLPVRETLQEVLRLDGRAFAVAHNHPSGDVTPSPEDVEITRRLAVAAPLVGLRFLDHVVVAGDEWGLAR